MQTMNVNIRTTMINKIENNANFVIVYKLSYFWLILQIDLKDMLGHFYIELETQIKKRGILFASLFLFHYFFILR